jgi:caa(3)-type oxidase subunit IV
MSQEDKTVHSEQHYIKIWGLLLGLLVISICGPMLEIQMVTLITAFGIAGVKAYIVACKFMHLEDEKNIISYILATMVLMAILFYAGTAPDVQLGKGANWEITPLFEKDLQSKHEWCVKWECPQELEYCTGQCDAATQEH